MLELLRALLAPRTDVALPEARGAISQAHGAPARSLVMALAGASRRIGKDPLVLDDGETGRLYAAGIDWPLVARVDELWRVTALLGAASGDDFERLVADAYRGGDTDERRAVLRALPLFPAPERFAALAADACRTSVRPIFEAIACENPYPARHLSALHFNQMVLKALFLDVSLARVRGLDGRRTAELARMARDYAQERRAAGRPVSGDLAVLAGESS
jgi:hypothetical protein